MNTKHYWSILFLLSALLISLLFSVFIRKFIIEEGLVATPLVWFTSPYTQELSSSDLQSIVSEIQQNPELLDNPGTITGIINNPIIMNDPTIAAAIASNTNYMSNTTIKSNQYVSAQAEATPIINPIKNVTPLSSANIQQQISVIQKDPTQLDTPGMITTILNNQTMLNDPTIVSAIINHPKYMNNTIIAAYPSIVTAIENNTTNPFNNTSQLTQTAIQQKISSIQMTPSQLDIPGMITIILNNKSIMNDPTVMAAIVDNATYMNNPDILQYINSINPNAITDTLVDTIANVKQLNTSDLSALKSEILADPTKLDNPGMITIILNNKTIMDDPTIAAAIIMRQTYMYNNMISTYPAIIKAYNSAIALTATPDNPVLPVAPLTPESFMNFTNDTNDTNKNILNSYNTAYTSNILPSWKS